MWLLRIQNQYKAYDITTENVTVNGEEYNINVAVKNTESLQGIHEYDITTENVAVSNRGEYNINVAAFIFVSVNSHILCCYTAYSYS